MQEITLADALKRIEALEQRKAPKWWAWALLTLGMAGFVGLISLRALSPDGALAAGLPRGGGGGGGGIASVAADTSPQLGGDLDLNGSFVTDATDNVVGFSPDGANEEVTMGQSGGGAQMAWLEGATTIFTLLVDDQTTDYVYMDAPTGEVRIAAGSGVKIDGASDLTDDAEFTESGTDGFLLSQDPTSANRKILRADTGTGGSLMWGDSDEVRVSTAGIEVLSGGGRVGGFNDNGFFVQGGGGFGVNQACLIHGGTDTLGIDPDCNNTANIAITTSKVDIVASQTEGTITLSSGTGTATTFSGATCVCVNTSTEAAVKCAVSGTTLTADSGAGADVIAYHCF